jgi:hypothetical protein
MSVRLWRLGAALCALALAAPAADPAKELLAAARNGDTARVRALLGAGASPEAKDKNGQTPLMLAAGNGYAETVRALLEKGANPSARDKTGRTAFDWAMFSSMKEKERDAVLAALPNRPRFRLYVDAVWLADNLTSSCFLSRGELATLTNDLHPDALVAGALVEYARTSGKDMVDILRTDTRSLTGGAKSPPPPAAEVDGTVRLEVRPGASCVRQYDNLFLAIDVHVNTPTSPGPVLVKTFGGGLKGLHAQPVANAGQYRPFFEKWSRTHAESIYWAVVKALLRAPT